MEEPLVVAEFGEDQHRGEEADHRPQLLRLLRAWAIGITPQRSPRRRPAPRRPPPASRTAGSRPTQDHDEHGEGQGFGERGVQGGSFGAMRRSPPMKAGEGKSPATTPCRTAHRHRHRHRRRPWRLSGGHGFTQPSPRTTATSAHGQPYRRLARRPPGGDACPGGRRSRSGAGAERDQTHRRLVSGHRHLSGPPRHLQRVPLVGGVTRNAAGVTARAPLTSGLANESPAHALFPGVSVTVSGVAEDRFGPAPLLAGRVEEGGPRITAHGAGTAGRVGQDDREVLLPGARVVAADGRAQLGGVAAAAGRGRGGVGLGGRPGGRGVETRTRCSVSRSSRWGRCRPRRPRWSWRCWTPSAERPSCRRRCRTRPSDRVPRPRPRAGPPAERSGMSSPCLSTLPEVPRTRGCR